MGNTENRSNELNPNNDAYWKGRGWDERPKDWKRQVGTSKPQIKKKK